MGSVTADDAVVDDYEPATVVVVAEGVVDVAAAVVAVAEAVVALDHVEADFAAESVTLSEGQLAC